MANITKLTNTELIDVLTNIASDEILEILNEHTCRFTIVRLDNSVALDIQKLNFKKDKAEVKEVVKTAVCFSMNDNSVNAKQYKGDTIDILLPNTQEIYISMLNEMISIEGNDFKDELNSEFVENEQQYDEQTEDEYTFDFEDSEDDSKDSDSEENFF